MSDSDVEIKKIPPMKPVKKPPNSPTADLLKAQAKKLTTKAMILEALQVLKTRKGVSIQSIKKYMEDKYYVETDKVKYLIKKALKTGIEDGSIIQLKGIGASGSFKLAPVKEKTKKLKTKKEPKKETKEKSKEKPTKDKKEKTMKQKSDKTKPAKKVKVKIDVKDKEKKEKSKDKKKVEKKEKLKSKTAATPAKKKATMIKRKSIGSIIKPPKMKPKSRA